MRTLGLDTSWRPLTNSTVKAKKVTPHTILLGVGGSIYTSNTLHHLEELGLDSQRAHKTALRLHAHSVHHAHKLTTTLEKTFVLKVWVWSRRLPATLQIPTSFERKKGKINGDQEGCRLGLKPAPDEFSFSFGG